jgi:methyl-accepting chemotaxis protein
VDESEVVTVRRPFLRRRILISGLQYRLLAVNLFSYCVVILIIAVILFLPPILELRSAPPSEDHEHVAVAFLFLHARLWPALLLVLVLLAFHSVINSHRIAGPLYRFQCVWRAAAEGDLSVRARLRKSDYLKNEAGAINEMIEALGIRISGLGEQATAMRAVFDDLKRARQEGSAAALDENLQRLGVVLDGLEARLGQFRVAAPAIRSVGPTTGLAPALIENE